MSWTIARRRWLGRIKRNMRTLAYSPCTLCARRSYVVLLLQRQRIRGTTPSRLRRYAGVVRNKPKSRPAPNQPFSITEKLKSAPAPRLEMSSTTTKKRRLSDSSITTPQPQRESKKTKSQDSLDPQPAKRSNSKGEPADPAFDLPKPQTKTKKLKPEEAPSAKVLSDKVSAGQDSNAASPGAKPAKVVPSPAKAPVKSAATTSKISKSWPAEVSKQRVKGLSNPGNFCYRRSLLQSLLCVPQFFNILSSHSQCKKPCVTCALRQLSVAYQTTPEGSSANSAVSAFDKAVAATGKKSDPRWTSISPTRQDDSHLFLLYLLETVEKSKGVPKDDFASVYKIKHRATWTCKFCKKVHINDGSNPASVSLQVPIVGGTLSTCLDALHTEDDTLIRCDGCKKQAKRVRSLQISSAPEVLTVQLKRFSNQGRAMNKNSRYVSTPEVLDLAPWAVDKATPLRYRLQAVVLQVGGLNSGHYIAYIKSANGWKEISDSHVDSMDISKLKIKERTGMTPYILTYVRA